jgi:TRAP-type mannitol/chloroaromatic compound transport system permease small subunit
MAELLPDDEGVVKPEHRGVTRLLDALVTWWALAGGFVFVALVAMSIISIVGRKLFSAPIEGDVELLMMGAAVGSAAFLPACEMHDHHIKVDALTTWMSLRSRAALDGVAHALLMVAACVITWRTVLYTIECHENMEVSTLLLVPLWLPVILMVPSFALLAASALYRCLTSTQLALGAKP